MLSSTLTHLQKVMQTKIYQLGQLLPVWPSSKLLASTRQHLLLDEIQQLSALPEEHFKALYRPAINQYAEFVQVLPTEPRGALGGLLNLGLVRATLALRQFANDAGSRFDADPLINYAIFTAGLFFDAAKMISQQQISICDSEGNYLQEWYPYLGSMVDQRLEYYKIYPYETTIYQGLNHDAAALLARQMMPSEGFAWLSSDLEIFIDWLASLRGEHGEGGRRISRALALLKLEDILELMRSLTQISIDLIDPKELQLDDQFYIWLREGLANGSIAINTAEASVHMLDNGLLYLNNELFKRFLEARKISGDAHALAGRFNERFGIVSQPIQEKSGYAAFLMQRGDQKIIQPRNGMFAYASLFIADTIGPEGGPLQSSPHQKEITSALKVSRELPGVKQTIAAVRRPDSGAGFKMR
jgi:hypothetical protein